MSTQPKPAKPLGRKSYGSIPHLPGSRRGPKDYGCHDGQARIATLRLRDRHDCVIVQEKLDGSNVAVAKVGGQILPLTRAGYHANNSPYEMHHRFAGWVQSQWERFDRLLAEGERLCGEWLYQAHGTRYDLPHEPFVGFDLITGEMSRLPFDEFVRRVKPFGIIRPQTLHVGGPLAIERVIALLGDGGGHGALDPVEGAVWRVERKGAVDFLCKFVRHDKTDGYYLPEISGRPAVINNWPGKAAPLTTTETNP